MLLTLIPALLAAVGTLSMPARRQDLNASVASSIADIDPVSTASLVTVSLTSTASAVPTASAVGNVTVAAAVSTTLPAISGSSTSPKPWLQFLSTYSALPRPSGARTPEEIFADIPDHELLNKPYLTLAHLDLPECRYPDKQKWKPDTPPVDQYGDPIEEPDIYVWNQLKMDDWLAACFEACPALGKVLTEDGKLPAPWHRQMYRYFIGPTSKSVPSDQCNNYRCQWTAYGDGALSLRGPVFTSGETPVLKEGATADDYEAYRRWYAMKTLANIWDYRKGVQRAINLAVPVAQSQIPELINTFLPDRLPASAPPSPLGAVLDVVGGIAAFTPYGPVVALAIGTAKFAISFAEENELGKFKAETAIKDTVVKLKAMQPQEERKGLSEEDRKKLGTAVWRAQVSGSDKIKATLKTLKAVKDLVKVARSPGKEEQLVEVVPVKFAQISSSMGAMFAQLSVALDEVDREIIEGDPWAAGGYMSLVTGGLFSGPVARDPMTGIPESALSKQLPMYVAYLEDKMLQMIMKSQELFLYKQVRTTEQECKKWHINATSKGDELQWKGLECIWNDGWTNYMPLTGTQLGAFGRPRGRGEDDRVYLEQSWPVITADMIPKLRGETTRDLFPLTIDDIYTQSDNCHRATIAKEMAAGAVTPQCDGTTALHPWPPAQALTASGDIPDSPLNALCHWNIPIIEPSIPGVSEACTKKHLADWVSIPSYKASFAGPESQSLACLPANTGSLIHLWLKLAWGRQEYPLIGTAAWYGRTMFYPKADCTCEGKPILYKQKPLTCAGSR